MTTAGMVLREWFWEAGDFTFWSIVITILYGVAMVAIFRQFKWLKRSVDREYRFLWKVILLIVIFMGVNKQLDLQTLFIISGRGLFEFLELYQYRKLVGAYFGVSFGIAAAGGLFLLLYKMRNIVFRAWVEIAGISLLLLFSVIRSASMNHIYKMEMFEHWLGRIHSLEFAGILLLIVALFRNWMLWKKR